jgi:beta-galactosidase/beta-glucuronidase
MKKRIILTLVTIIALFNAHDEGHIMTSWGENIDAEDVWNQYPRPIMERNQWMNLNGQWNYSIRHAGESTPTVYDGKILVPFAAESALSGVEKRVGPENELWYNRSFKVPTEWGDNNVLLNFGAVDWACDVWVNNKLVGSHTGGYTPFSMDITGALNRQGDNELTVRVWDPTDQGYQPRGKQVSTPGGIWYTPVTGIWQTVWLEPINSAHITKLHILPDIDNGKLTIDVSATTTRNASIEVKVLDSGKVIAQAKGKDKLDIPMPAGFKLWSPDTPNLYDLEVKLYSNGKCVDTVKSYAAMRKFSTAKDKDGIIRLQLNNKDLFQFGPLDQGWWPDGLYTAPSYEAMIYDIDKTKDWGFNMIRKHIKVEPATWYSHCDHVGIIVWQDMPSGDNSPQWQNHNYFNGDELVRSQDSENTYRKEWAEIIDCLYSYPCISTWIPFNEAWGQFKTSEIAEWTKAKDPSRLVNPASGGNFYKTGDILDLHNYPGPAMYLFDPTRANVLGEYGGIGLAIEGHLWSPSRNWGYVQYNTTEEVTNEYETYANQLYDLIVKGFTGAVYTQTTDVENEVNGIMTYDRKVIKMDEERIRAINHKITHSLDH